MFNPSNMSNIGFVIYKLSTGEILSKISTPKEMGNVIKRPSTEFGYFNTDLNINPAVQYMANGEIVDRPVFVISDELKTIKANGVDAFKLTGIPKGAVCVTDENDFAIDDGVFEFTTEKPGQYFFTIEAFPYQSLNLTIKAQ